MAKSKLKKTAEPSVNESSATASQAQSDTTLPVWQTREVPPVRRKMLTMLSDGLPHTMDELHSCLYDDMCEVSHVRKHIYEIRKWLRPKGMDILVQFVDRKMHYRWVRLLHPAE